MRKQTEKFWKVKAECTTALPEKNIRFHIPKIVLEIRYTVNTESTLKKVTHTPSTITLINITYLNSD